MKKIVNYLAFLFALLMIYMTSEYPESARDLLGRKLSAAAQVGNRFILGALLIGTGYLALRQGIEDYRARKNKKSRE
jgi:hypothetical protein